MEQIPEVEVERLMRVREVILQAMAKKITWWQAAEILGISVRTMRRWKWQYEQHGFRGIRDKRKGKPSWRKVPMEEVNQVLALYRERYYATRASPSVRKWYTVIALQSSENAKMSSL